MKERIWLVMLALAVLVSSVIPVSAQNPARGVARSWTWVNGVPFDTVAVFYTDSAGACCGYEPGSLTPAQRRALVRWRAHDLSIYATGDTVWATYYLSGGFGAAVGAVGWMQVPLIPGVPYNLPQMADSVRFQNKPFARNVVDAAGGVTWVAN